MTLTQQPQTEATPQIDGAMQPALDAETLNFRPRKLSPWEQYRKRLNSVLPPREMPDSVIALLLHKQFRAQVTKGGEIHLTHLGKTYKFWHLDSVTCRRVGEEIFFSWDPEQPEFIYVIDREKKQFVEVVPAKNLVQWFVHDENTKAEIAAHRSYQKQMFEQLTALHRPTTAEELERITDNSKKMRATLAFDVPRSTENFPTNDASAKTRESVPTRTRPIPTEATGHASRDNRPADESTPSAEPRFPIAEEVARAGQAAGRSLQRRAKVAKVDVVKEQLKRAKTSVEAPAENWSEPVAAPAPMQPIYQSAEEEDWSR